MPYLQQLNGKQSLQLSNSSPLEPSSSLGTVDTLSIFKWWLQTFLLINLVVTAGIVKQL